MTPDSGLRVGQVFCPSKGAEVGTLDRRIVVISPHHVLYDVLNDQDPPQMEHTTPLCFLEWVAWSEATLCEPKVQGGCTAGDRQALSRMLVGQACDQANCPPPDKGWPTVGRDCPTKLLRTTPRTMILMNKTLMRFANAWLVLAVMANAAAVFGAFARSASFYSGISSTLSIYNPFDITNLLTQIALFLPIFVALYWRHRRLERSTA